LPKFPDGRIDYTFSDTAPVITCIVKVNDKFLLLKRSDKVENYKGKWNVISGYLDDFKSLNEKALEELEQETGISREQVSYIEAMRPYRWLDDKIKKTWLVYPVIIELKKQQHVTLDWEHTDFCWVAPNDIFKFDLLPDLLSAFKRCLHELESEVASDSITHEMFKGYSSGSA
jgi:8-oxo-dGTP pyrophosphatase MutT (NUDIX family)